ncbi:hypothetical protein EON63_04345 [archaeon]|nr:MAG: hypothetical protein EON63_04345 [archaeon]
MIWRKSALSPSFSFISPTFTWLTTPPAPSATARLESAGFGIGQRAIELVSCRDRVTRRETRIVSILQYVSQVLWKYLFNKTADNLERSMQNEDECKAEHCVCMGMDMGMDHTCMIHQHHTCLWHTICIICMCMNYAFYTIHTLDMIHESAPLVNTYISVPGDMGALTCAAFCAGIVAGALDAARFVSTVYDMMCMYKVWCL